MNDYAHMLLTCARRQSINRESWDKLVDKHPLGWWWHRSDWLDYCKAYRGGKELSFVYYTQNQNVAGMVPMFVEKGVVLAGGNPAPFPLIGVVDNSETRAAMQDFIKLAISYNAQSAGAVYGDFMLHPMLEEYQDDQRRKEEGDSLDSCEYRPFKTRVIDLSIPEQVRWTSVRRSYRQFIHKGDHALIVHESASAFAEYQKMHQDQYGNPRPQATYDIQAQWCRNGSAVVYVATDMHHNPVGAMLWIIYKRHAYYASGVFAQHQCSHWLMWQSLKLLGIRGIRYAETGWQGRATNDKERNIEFFKRGFGGADWHIPCWRRYYGVHENERKGTA